MNNASRALVHYAHTAAHYTDGAIHAFRLIPGSEMIVRYIRSSYQNDPVRSVIELALAVFVLVYVAKSRFSTERSRVVLSDDEVDELVAEWVPEPLVARETEKERVENEKRPVIVGQSGPKSKLSNGRVVTNLASANYYNFIANEALKERAIATLRKYGVGPCGPPNFYGTQDVHMHTEADIVSHLGVQACIVYAQAFSTITSVIPAFSKRGDIIVADRASNYSIRKGIQLSRSTVYWYNHNDMEDLERTLQNVVKIYAKKPLTRRFIVAEGLSENVGDMTDLPKIVQLKQKYKFRLILDETWSYGVLGATGRGITEYQHVDPGQVDMLIGSLAGPLAASGGFCAGSKEVVEHQRIASAAYTFSAALPAISATQASETVRILSDSPELIIQLKENIKTMRAQLDPRSQYVRCTSAPENPMMLLVFKNEVLETRKLSDEEQEMLMQDIIEESMTNGVFITRVKPLPETINASAKEQSQSWQPQPALKVCMTTALSKKDIEKAGTTIRHAITKIMTRKQ
ncbi:serine palmitoyltransferase 1 [Microthyrium microscopicum]|uniref:serine C-palmitoyltransferase n=1 Tax=Microthyrium microscopicum TaxID=703497 RepID=A0A6A6U373_9PEZI|nr:serine palmitoyltransferase 1 [Microthyrium microscopicum]